MGQVYEAYNSRVVNIGWDTGDATLYFFQIGEDDDAAARSAFASAIPSTFAGLLLLSVNNIEHIGGGFWQCEAVYGTPKMAEIDGGFGDPGAPPPAAGDPGGPPSYSGDTSALGAEIGFEVSGQTERVYLSKQTVAGYPAPIGVNSPNNKNLIGVTADGEVEGVDRISPYFEFNVSVTVGFVTRGYIKTLRDLVGTTNNAAFYGYDIGEVLLLGVSGRPSDGSKVTLTYKFGVRKNEVINLDLISGAEAIAKKGWEYLWISYSNVENVNQLTQQPKYAYVERIYDASNFANLSIGG